MVPGLLPIFLHDCEINSGSGLRTSINFTNALTVLHSKRVDFSKLACKVHSKRTMTYKACVCVCGVIEIAVFDVLMTLTIVSEVVNKIHDIQYSF